MNTQRLKKPGCHIVIRDGFTDIDGNPVTSVQIIPDCGWRLDGTRVVHITNGAEEDEERPDEKAP